MAGACLNFCYAQVAEIKGKRKVHAIRIHDSGDFFSRAYFLVWKSIMEACPNTNFYAYTKMVPLFKKLEAEGMLPANFTVIYSQGGKFDHLIDKNKDRHSHVFSSEEDCIAAGYVLNEVDDMPATDRTIKKIGLVVHGPIVYNKMMGNAVAEHNAA